MTERPLVWVGIDVGETHHHACVMDPTGKIVFSRKIANDQSAIEQLVVRAGKTATEVRWAIDLTSNTAALLVAVLVATGQQVVYVPGRVVNRMTGVFRGEAKSDAKDARVIAETARMRTDLTVVTATDDLVVELTRLTAHREDLMADWVRGINRLRDLLTSIFPARERAFDYSTRSALLLVAGFQTDREIKDTDKLIKDRFRTHPQAEIIESLPGLGPILGAEFVVATGGNLAGFATSGRLASYAGLVPVPRDAGRITGNPRRPKRYNRKPRRVFYMAALSSIRTAGPSRAFYDRKRGERLIHTQALLALARRLVDVLWALPRDGRTFTLTAPQPANTAA